MITFLQVFNIPSTSVTSLEDLLCQELLSQPMGLPVLVQV